MKKQYPPKIQILSTDGGTLVEPSLDQLITDVEGLERLSAMQLKLIREIRRQLDRLAPQQNK